MAKDADNKSFLLRIDSASMDALERWASDEFRSVNGQLQWIVADALRRAGRSPHHSASYRPDSLLHEKSNNGEGELAKIIKKVKESSENKG
ncbi:MAG: DNA-binding protein [Bacteroidaceae bacterium]|nr:DNA-binding protein [Bacteroidaceae bacterium]